MFFDQQTGTHIEIRELRKANWSRREVRRLHNQITSICSPFEEPEGFEARLHVPGNESWIDDLPDIHEILDRAIWKFSFRAEDDKLDWTYEFREVPGLALDGRVVRKTGDPFKLPSRSGDDRMEKKVVADATVFKGIGPVTGEFYVYDRGQEVRRRITNIRLLESYLDETGGVRAAVDAEALLPDGPYDLWRDDDDARRVTDLVGAFARYPRLPKLLHPKILLDTVLQGVERGLFVARLVRPDGSARTWWREPVGAEARQDPLLEVVLPDRCEITAVSATLLGPGVLPELWNDGRVTVSEVRDYFAGGRTVRVAREGYEETQIVPRCSERAVHEAVREAVEQGVIWLTNGPTSVWKEQIPHGVLDDSAVLHPQPDPIPGQELVADALPGAWREGKTNGVALARALSQSRRKTLPWGLVRDGIKAGVDSRWLEVADGSVAVHCRYDEAGQLRLKRPAAMDDPAPPPPMPAVTGALLEGSQIQDLAELVPKLLEASAGNDLRFRVGATLNPDAGGNIPQDLRTALDALLATVSAGLKIE